MVRPIYKILLGLAIVGYVIASCIMHADLYHKLGQIEHILAHISSGHTGPEEK